MRLHRRIRFSLGLCREVNPHHQSLPPDFRAEALSHNVPFRTSLLVETMLIHAREESVGDYNYSVAHALAFGNNLCSRFGHGQQEPHLFVWSNSCHGKKFSEYCSEGTTMGHQIERIQLNMRCHTEIRIVWAKVLSQWSALFLLRCLIAAFTVLSFLACLLMRSLNSRSRVNFWHIKRRVSVYGLLSCV